MKLPYDIHTNPTWQDMVAARRITDDVARGRRRMGMLCSDTGFGKTWLLKTSMRRADVRWEYANPDDQHALIKVLWKLTQQKIDVAVLDDCDRVARSETLSNLLKSAFGDERKIVHQSVRSIKNEDYRVSDDLREQRRYSPLIPPLEFDVMLRLLWLSNNNMTDPAVIGALPQHFRALASKGLDPRWIRNNPYDVFLYVVWLASYGNGLRNAGFKYEHARDAVRFYVANVDRLIDTCPRRLYQIAATIRDNRNSTERAERLEDMLRPDAQRDRMTLPEPWVLVQLWPDAPPTRAEPAPTARPEPPQPELPGATQPEPEAIVPEWVAREPDAAHGADTPVEPVANPEPETLTMSAAIDLIYHRREVETCESVATVLQRCALAEWDEDDFSALTEQLQGAANWDHEHNGLAHAFFHEEKAPILFGDRTGVLLYKDGGLQILSWGQVQEQMAPVLAMQEQRRDRERRENEAQAIFRKMLPPQRKLKAMLALIDQLFGLKPDIIWPDVTRGIAYVRTMTADHPQFAECKTFTDFLAKAAEIAEPAPEPIVPEWVAREETPGDDRGDILVEPVTETQAERGEPLSDINPPPNLGPDPLDVPLRPLSAEETKVVQTQYDLPKWKGRITKAHQLRAAFFRACEGQCPPAMRNYPNIWWAGMTGQIPRAMIAKATPLMIEHAA